MEKLKRQAFQGVGNIIRFNWHFYVVATILVVVLIFAKKHLPYYLTLTANVAIIFTITTTFISLAISYFIYDYSDLYSLNWLNFLSIKPNTTLVNINAGFDETSAIIKEKFPNSNLLVFDFYDANKHTEISIERARKAYPIFPDTQIISTDNIPLQANSVDYIFLIFAAHEIRNEDERILFFKQLKDALINDGKIIVIEHQRDIPNFIAYTIGFFHFHSTKTWKQTFERAELPIVKEFKITPFITSFILTKNGITS